jgi:hypothetical protein
MIVKALPDDLTTAHNYSTMTVMNGRVCSLLKAEVEVDISLHCDDVESGWSSEKCS